MNVKILIVLLLVIVHIASTTVDVDLNEIRYEQQKDLCKVYESMAPVALERHWKNAHDWVQRRYRHPIFYVDTINQMPISQVFVNGHWLGTIEFDKVGMFLLTVKASPSTEKFLIDFSPTRFIRNGKQMVYFFGKASKERFEEYLFKIPKGETHSRIYTSMANFFENANKEVEGAPWQLFLTQGPIESDYGDSKLARKMKNELGIKCFVHSRAEHKRMVREKISSGTCMNTHDDHWYDHFLYYNTLRKCYEHHSDIVMGRTSTRDYYMYYDTVHVNGEVKRIGFDQQLYTKKLKIRKDLYWIGLPLKNGETYTFKGYEWWYIGRLSSYATSAWYPDKVVQFYLHTFLNPEILGIETQKELEEKVYWSQQMGPFASN